MKVLDERTAKFRLKLESLGRDRLLELIKEQDIDLFNNVRRIEWVFANKMSHIRDKTGEPITSRPFTNKELSYLIDEPFSPCEELTDLGISVAMQREIHTSRDAVLWAKNTLDEHPRAYQVLMIRDPSLRKVMRLGRRMGKTFSMALILLHYAWTTPDGRCIIVTPMKTQGGLIYEEIMRFIKKNPSVENEVKRNVTSPQYEINFANGSSIRFFSSGTKSGGKSDVTRGQEAHIIVLDEMDYMNPEDLTALYAMLMATQENQPDKQLIGASTPTGLQQVFYEWCTDPTSGFSSFWFPAYCNPLFTMENEIEFHKQYGEMEYRHEIEADWGEPSDGVYPRRYIDHAFSYGDWSFSKANEAARPDEKTFTVMGVDWDKYVATPNIVVLRVYDTQHGNKPMRGKIKLVYREAIPKDDFALINAVDRIKVLNSLFKPKHIYVDRGFGEVQVEMLQRAGLEDPLSGLAGKVRGVAFRETIEVWDPVSYQKVKKEAKPFMIHTLRQYLETERMMFAESDEDLFKQLISYIVTIRPSGTPHFEAAGSAQDHIHDALILACLAIVENYGDFSEADYGTESIAVSSMNFNPLVIAGNGDYESYELEKEKAEEKWGEVSSSPIYISRKGSYRTKSGPRPIKRKSF